MKTIIERMDYKVHIFFVKLLKMKQENMYQFNVVHSL